MDERLMEGIKEAGYLYTQKSHRYRPIIRYMYERTMAYSPLVLPSEIISYLKQFPFFQDYSEDELIGDLNSLVKNNNMEQIQDKGKVKTYEDYKRNRYRYKLTPHTIELEKALINMESNLQSIRGSLEKSLTDRLLEELEKLFSQPLSNEVTKAEAQKVNDNWESLFDRFNKLISDAGLYLSHINGEKLELIMRTESFIIFKNAFVDYLQNFISALKKNADKIKANLNKITDEKIDSIISTLILHQKSIPRLDELPPDEELYSSFKDKWVSFKSWFISNERESDVYYLEKQTMEMIRKISKMAQQAAERQRYIKSRKTDFLHLAKVVSEFDDIDKANHLFSLLFGIEKTRHIKIKDLKESDSTQKSIWDFPPSPIVLKARKETERAAVKRHVVNKNSKERKELMEKYKKQKEKEENLEKELVNKKHFKIDELEVVQPYQRTLLLNWIGKAMANKSPNDNTYFGKTENGYEYMIIKKTEDKVSLASSDGTLTMPDYEFIFEELK
ncbi:TIGR02677 family protein [Cytobacillus sp. FSL R5-0596]|uniref:TIGR02677 family protein n=1 Tax=Cytobacillus sp. FSL R5-0596 TaxID=2954696 RepID=UPI0030FBF90A